MLRALARLLTVLYILVFNTIYPLVWYSSLWTLRIVLWCFGRQVPMRYTDWFATWWGIGQVRPVFFLNRTRLVMEFDARVDEYDGPFIVLMNHQSTYDIGLAFTFLWQRRRHIRWVLKRELLKAPVVRQGCKEMKCAFVDRNDPEQAEQEIKRFAAQLERDQVSGVIFVEGTRSTPRKLAKSDFSRLMNPRPKGLSLLHNALPNWPLLSVTLDWSGMQGKSLFGSSIWENQVRVQAKMYAPDEVGDDIVAWLREDEWPRCNALIESWREESDEDEPHKSTPILSENPG